MTTSTGADYSLNGYDILTEGDDFVMYRHQGKQQLYSNKGRRKIGDEKVLHQKGLISERVQWD